MSAPILLVLGAGANVGSSVARLFRSKGYKVAVAARNVAAEVAGSADLAVKADFSDPSNIKLVFDEVKSKLGNPSVVVYNAAFMVPSAADNILSPSVADLTTSLSINTVSAYAAAQEAVSAFDQLPAGSPKTFIYTGNCLNVMPMAMLFSLGLPKAATAHLIEVAASSKSYGSKGYSFYYGDQRKADGMPVGNQLSGQAHAEFYYELAQKKEQGPWQATFVPGTGYVDFGKK